MNVLDQQHHNQHERGDHEGVLDNGGDHCFNHNEKNATEKMKQKI